ncbi:enolase C-terminal domain-like protein [Dyadobacter fanqingshengii]|uniref:Mandelate racemase/muconate lactonizing enzyme family protein n=1 Tax=Dyadobacter fanqingshengii TaxID=2906443 RepID=A0A9X1THP4_9BACT|nr:enolase C-terminal domain-like protein [Dyadobacter fanqingshengii]MCF0041902.1 mandelate racemase/muconate lactonizing enzyme family protein [Dyadobacter fanqingshengii]MCF2504856.1 mandelate racemase/muconate lactonizing enzyme family protein [Dyadobacter fanqingshengii]USJ36392.1 mandelate racemase/muconate lactonizing enzyme family protein [Dyadobacter fanqingshengii]
MHRRTFLKSTALGSAAVMTGLPLLKAEAASKMKITKIRYYAAPGYNKPLFNQARGIVEIETDGGIIGIGEGGSKDMIEQCAQMMIGEDPFRIEHIWQNVYRGMFYPPGREKLHALGALEMALWDIKGKALNVPVYELLGGATRDYIECYATGFRASKAKTEEERAQDCIAAGLRSYRIGPTGGNGDQPFDFYDNVKKTIEFCKRIDTAVGGGGKWAIDLHTRFDLTDGLKICTALEDLEPYFIEDIVRSENPGVYKNVRSMTKVPIAVGEQFGDRWDTNELIENRLIDYTRFTLPNTGGIGEFKKIASMCETHYVGMIPHFTGPLSTATLVHVLGSSSPMRAMMELGGGEPERPPYFNEDFINFKNGKLYLNDSPGLGVKFDPKKATFVMEVKEKTKFPHPILKAPDGSIHNW